MDYVQAIATSGGFSVQPVTGEVPGSGFMVAIFKGVERVVTRAEFSGQLVADFVGQHAALFQAAENAFLGGWLDGGQVYLDVSVNVPTLEAALELGREHDQLAVYDVASGTSIDCGVGVAL